MLNRELAIAIGRNRAKNNLHWTNKTVTWGDVLAWSDSKATSKDTCISYVGGELSPTTRAHEGTPCEDIHRVANAIVRRSIVTLDADHLERTSDPDGEKLRRRVEESGWEATVQLSWSSAPGAARLRVILLPDRDITPDEYGDVARYCMKMLDPESSGFWDATCDQPERFWYLPKTSIGSQHYAGRPLDVDGAVLLAPARDVVAATRGPGYVGVGYAEMSAGEQLMAEARLRELERQEKDRLDKVSGWDDDKEDDSGNGWDAILRDSAGRVARWVLTPWLPLDGDTGRALWDRIAPPSMVEECGDKWERALDWAATCTIERPPWADLLEYADGAGVGRVINADGEVVEAPIPDVFDDFGFSAWMARIGLDGRWCWTKQKGWRRWDERRWQQRSNESLGEAVRVAVIRAEYAVRARFERERSGDNEALLKAVRGLKTAKKLRDVTSVMKGVAEVAESRFDAVPWALNSGDGVIDLRDGMLGPHDKELYLTKITETRYIPGKRHPDWDQCLTALDESVVAWLQLKFGQGITGEPANDDVLPILQGQGSNGKSTINEAMIAALGDHMTQVPAKLLLGNPSDHPTEFMKLKGARLAYLDETPEEGHLNVQRLKAIVGQSQITARDVYEKNTTWRATHTLFIMTNYMPQVAQTDDGTWRRVVIVKFMKKFPRNDAFRDAMRSGSGGRAEAVLAWLVEGAVSWYATGAPHAPALVRGWTDDWRADNDVVMGYLLEKAVFGEGACVLASDFYDDVNEWLRSRRLKPWSSKLIAARFEAHEKIREAGVYRVKWQRDETPPGLHIRPGLTEWTGRPTVWQGMTLSGFVEATDKSEGRA